jgi:branched-chain amino acid transport system substrate-binding protein
MSSKPVRIGLMFSTTGSYSVVTKTMLNGALLALSESSQRFPDLVIEPSIVNPEGEIRRYGELAEGLLKDGIRHIVGCYTSLSRKEVIPLFEKYDSLLWYPTHYEGFETSNNVIYTGAAPNQHILPLLDYMLAKAGRKAFCVGSNYIWAWENTRVFREAITIKGGSVVAEKYAAIGDTDMRQIVDTIISERPDFIFSNLIGSSAYAFFRQLRSACEKLGIDQPTRMPVASCSLSEPELEEIGAGCVDGHYSSSVYFSTVRTSANESYTKALAAAFPGSPAASADSEAAYIATTLLLRSISDAQSDDIKLVKKAALNQRIAAPQGQVWLDPQTFHSWLTPRIGRSNKASTFDIVEQAGGPVRPDPYLVESSPRHTIPSSPAQLRIVT